MKENKNYSKKDSILKKDIMPNKRHTEFSQEFSLSDVEKNYYNKDFDSTINILKQK